MPKPTIEQLEAEKKKAAAELEKAMQKKEQLEHQMSRLLNRDKQAERKARTRRLIERGAILASFPKPPTCPARKSRRFCLRRNGRRDSPKTPLLKQERTYIPLKW